MAKIIVYGIPNCDTIKKTMDWFKANKVETTFHDYKKEGVSKEKLKAWSKRAGMDVLLNKRSTTWKGLTPAQQESAASEAAAINLMMENTSLIKRPVIESGKDLLIGFDEKKLSDIFKK